MTLSETSKRADALVERILQLCGQEGASVREVKLAAMRFERIATSMIEDLEADIPFTPLPRLEN